LFLRWVTKIAEKKSAMKKCKKSVPNLEFFSIFFRLFFDFFPIFFGFFFDFFWIFFGIFNFFEFCIIFKPRNGLKACLEWIQCFYQSTTLFHVDARNFSLPSGEKISLLKWISFFSQSEKNEVSGMGRDKLLPQEYVSFQKIVAKTYWT